jgi:hypothetical protein
VDQHRQVIDVLVSRTAISPQSGGSSPRRCRRRHLPGVTDRALALANVIGDSIQEPIQNTGLSANKRCEARHGSLKARMRPHAMYYG